MKNTLIVVVISRNFDNFKTNYVVFGSFISNITKISVAFKTCEKMFTVIWMIPSRHEKLVLNFHNNNFRITWKFTYRINSQVRLPVGRNSPLGVPTGKPSKDFFRAYSVRWHVISCNCICIISNAPPWWTNTTTAPHHATKKIMREPHFARTPVMMSYISVLLFVLSALFSTFYVEVE